MRFYLLALCLLAGCSSIRPEAPPTGPFHLRYDGDQAAAHDALIETLDAHRFVVVRAEADLGVIRTAPQPIRLVDTPSAGVPDTAQVWFRLSEGQDGRTVVAARPMLRIRVPRDLQDSTSATVPLLADLPATHPLARTVVGHLAEAGFTLLPRRVERYAGIFLGHEVYDVQP